MDRVQIKKKLFFWYFMLWLFLIISLFQGFFVYFVDTTSTKSKWVGLFAGAIAILMATCKILEISYYETKNPIFSKLNNYFKIGTNIFTKRIAKVSLFCILLISIILFKKIGLSFVITFVCGSIFAIINVLCSGYIMSRIVTRTSQFYKETKELMYKQILNAGIAISCLSVGFLIIPLVILFHIYKDYQLLNAFVFGALIFSVLNNIAISVSKHSVNNACEVINDNFSEIEKNDKRNPLLLLSGTSKAILGTNILTSDLFVSFGAIIVSAMTVGAEFLQLMGMFLPIIIASSGIFATIITLLIHNPKKNANPIKNMFKIIFVQNVLLVLFTCYLIKTWLPDVMNLTYTVLFGSLGGFIACFLHVNYVFNRYRAVVDVSNASISGLKYSISQITKEGFCGVFFPSILCMLILVASFLVSGGIEEPSMGLYGIMLAILGMVSSVGVIIAILSFGYTSSKSDIIIDTYEEDINDLRENQINNLKEYGTKILSLGKNFINIVSIMAAISAFIAYTILIGLEEIDIINPYVLSSMIIGASIPFLFSGMILKIASKTTRRLILETKRQFRSFPQITRFELRPDYEKCVDLSAFNSSIQIVVSFILIFVIEALILIKFDIEAIGGFIFAIILSSFGIIFLISGSSSLVKSAKKYFLNQFSYVKPNEQLDIINLNEAIFSSFKDLVVPALNSLIKFVSILALTLFPLIV